MESRGESSWGYGSRYSSESSYGSESRSYIKRDEKTNQYADIDALIERLEKEAPPNSSNSEAVNREINVRNQKLAELKKLRKQAEQVKQAEMDMKRVKEEQEELDRALKTLSGVTEKSSVTMGRTSSNLGFSSESSVSSESRSYNDSLSPAHEKTIGHVYIGESVGESRW